MHEDEQPTNVEHPVETGVLPAVPAPPAASEPLVTRRTKLAFLSSTRVIGIGVVAVVAVAGLGFYGHQLYARNTNIQTPSQNVKPIVNKPAQTHETPAQDAATLSQQGAKAPTSSTPAKTPATSAAPMATPAPAPAPAPGLNTTNCLPPNPSSYATSYTSMTNSQYLQTNGYVNTTKLYAALQFAGLIDTINSKQYVVLAMDDSAWNNFTQAQLNWMNASPANMRSVLGWQVVTSCITWNGVNPVKDMTVGATRTVTTLNGAVTYTHNTDGLGTFGNGKVGIWDWFTSNGSVTIAGFVDTSSIP